MSVTAADMDIRFGVSGADKAESTMRSVGRGFDSLATKGQRAGGFLRDAMSFATGDLIAAGVRKVDAAIRSFVGGTLDFGAQMANVNSILQLSNDQLADLQEEIISLSNQPGIRDTPAQLAAGLYNIASSGFTGAEGLKVLEAAAISASAGMTSTEVAAQGITAVLNAYGMSADQAGRVSDIMFQTVNDGVITFEQLALNMGNTLPAANALGVSFEELGAAYAQMTLKGVSASAAETQIAAVMKASMNPTASLTAAVNAHGYATAKAAIDSVGFAGYLAIVMEAAGGNEAALYDMLGTQEAVNAALILGADGASDYADEVDRMTNSTGASQKALEQQMKSARYQLQQVKKELMVLGTEILIGFEPIVAGGARTVAGFVAHLVDGAKYVKSFFEPQTYTDAAKYGIRISQTDMLLQKLPASYRGAAMAAATYTRATFDLAKGFVNAFQEGSKVEDLVKLLPKSLQGFGSAVFTIADDLGDIFRQIRQGDWSGLWEELKQTGGHAIKVVADVIVTLGEFIWGEAKDLWSWAMDQIGSSSTPWSPGMSPSEVGSSDGKIRIGSLSLETDLGDLSWSEAIDWADFVSQLVSDADQDISTALGLVRTQEQLDEANQAGYDTGYTWGQSLGEQIRKGFSDGSESDSTTGADDSDFWSIDTIKKILKWEPPFARDDDPTFIDEWVQWANGLGAGFRHAVFDGFTSAVLGDEQTSGVGAGSHVERSGGLSQLSDDLFAAIQGWADDIEERLGDAWDDLEDALTPDLSGFESPQMPDWMSTDLSWINDPVSTVTNAIDTAIQTLKDGWNRLKFWESGGQTKGQDLSPYIPQFGAGTYQPNEGGGGGVDVLPQYDNVPQKLGNFGKIDTSGADLAKQALQELGDAFTKAHEPADKAASDVDAAMAQLGQSVARRAAMAGSNLNTALGAAMAQAAAISAQGAAGVDGAMSWLPGALYGRGANASRSFAQGLWSGVGEAQAAANALAAAADRAVASRLAIHSPSRVMADHAKMAVEGFVGGLTAGMSDVSGAYARTFSPGEGTNAYRPAPAGGNKVTIISVHSDEIQKIAEMARSGHEFVGGFSNEFDMLRAGGLR